LLPVRIVTQWSGSGWTEAYLSCQLASFSALTLWLCHLACKTCPEMTYKASSGMLSLYSLLVTSCIIATMALCVCACAVYLFYEFDKFWFIENPADIMQFNAVRDKFVNLITDELHRPTAQLMLDFTAAS